MLKRIIDNFAVAFEAVLVNKVRSLLTALGIIFGVASVIAMLAIGGGARQEILEQIKIIGVNNIIVKPINHPNQSKTSRGEENEKKAKFSPGLTLNDAEAIKRIIPVSHLISPEIIFETQIIGKDKTEESKLVGVINSFFKIGNFKLASGVMFNDFHHLKGEPVCIIGKDIRDLFFPTENPIGKKLKCGDQWLNIVGVLQKRIITKKNIAKLGIRNYNMDVYTPISTLLIRYKNRGKVTKSMVEKENQTDFMRFFQDGSIETNIENKEKASYHQLDRLVVQVEETELLVPTSQVLSRLLRRRHHEVDDFEISIPEILLRQQQRTKNIFNIVLGAIAGISLLVGGIGIMNIMLASVLERIKEIGIRLSVGAKKLDITLQFLFESIIISLVGGTIGVLLGIVMAYAVTNFANIPTIITFFSIILSFGVAIATGVVFGIAPARKAASQDPISSLRYE